MRATFAAERLGDVSKHIPAVRAKHCLIKSSNLGAMSCPFESDICENMSERIKIES